MTYIGGPTALLEMGGLRLLTDPTFDAGGSEYRSSLYTLRKTKGPAVEAGSLGTIDVVLLSHDHHVDNLDTTGRRLLDTAAMVVTTRPGADRIGGQAIGLAPWEFVDRSTVDGRTLRIMATPARHGPPDGDRGPVIGFALTWSDAPDRAVYVSGDTVWYDGVVQVSQRVSAVVAILFMGAARVHEVGPSHLTLTAQEAVEAARTFRHADIVPVHFEGWEHFSESRAEIDRAFHDAGLGRRLRWLEPGVATDLPRLERSEVKVGGAGASAVRSGAASLRRQSSSALDTRRRSSCSSEFHR